MPSGKLGAVDLSAGVNTTIFSMPGGRSFTIAVNICNRNDVDIKIRLALTDGALSTLSSEDYLEYDTLIRANGVLGRTLTMAAEQSLVGYSDTSNVSVQVWNG